MKTARLSSISGHNAPRSCFFNESPDSAAAQPCHGLGVAWWARIQTSGPDVTYWFGPFITRQGLESELSSFLDDVKSEQPQSISHSLLRTRRSEPLTITAEG